MVRISAGAGRNAEFQSRNPTAEQVRPWGRQTRELRAHRGLARVRCAEYSQTGTRETVEVRLAPCSHFSSGECCGTREEKIAHGGVRDVREPVSHVADSYRRRTNGEGARQSEIMEAVISSHSLKCCR